MTDKKLKELLKRHTNAQGKVNDLYATIINELDERGLLNERDVLSCMNNTEPPVWEDIIVKLIEEGK